MIKKILSRKIHLMSSQKLYDYLYYENNHHYLGLKRNLTGPIDANKGSYSIEFPNTSIPIQKMVRFAMETFQKEGHVDYTAELMTECPNNDSDMKSTLTITYPHGAFTNAFEFSIVIVSYLKDYSEISIESDLRFVSLSDFNLLMSQHQQDMLYRTIANLVTFQYNNTLGASSQGNFNIVGRQEGELGNAVREVYKVLLTDPNAADYKITLQFSKDNPVIKLLLINSVTGVIETHYAAIRTELSSQVGSPQVIAPQKEISLSWSPSCGQKLGDFLFEKINSECHRQVGALAHPYQQYSGKTVSVNISNDFLINFRLPGPDIMSLDPCILKLEVETNGLDDIASMKVTYPDGTHSLHASYLVLKYE